MPCRTAALSWSLIRPRTSAPKRRPTRSGAITIKSRFRPRSATARIPCAFSTAWTWWSLASWPRPSGGPTPSKRPPARPLSGRASAGRRSGAIPARSAPAAFSAAKLLRSPSGALIAGVSLGQNPIGLASVRDGREIVVADADLLPVPGEDNLALISTPKALQGQDRVALLGFTPTGLTPRELAVEPGGQTLLATDNNSGQVQAIDVGSLP